VGVTKWSVFGAESLDCEPTGVHSEGLPSAALAAETLSRDRITSPGTGEIGRPDGKKERAAGISPPPVMVVRRAEVGL
jgi:hypothetical protein